jgi:hypothetical protein
VVTFNGTNGSAPLGLLADNANDILGDDTLGADTSNLFEIPSGSTTLTASKANLTSIDTLIQASAGITFDSSNDLFLLYTDGGTGNQGAIYEVTANGSAPVLVASLSTLGSDTEPFALAIDAQNNLFGACHQGGANGDGFIFELPAGTSTPQDIADFNGTNGSAPVALIVDGSGNVYGIASAGGLNQAGDVFEVAAVSHALTDVADFSATQYTDGTLAIDGSGNLFGTVGDANASNPDADDFVFSVNRTSDTVIEVGSGFSDFWSSGAVDGAANIFLLYGPGWMSDGAGSPFVGEVSVAQPTLSDIIDLPGALPGGSGNTLGLVVDASDNVWISAEQYSGTQGVVWESPASLRAAVRQRGAAATTVPSVSGRSRSAGFSGLSPITRAWRLAQHGRVVGARPAGGRR